MRDRVARDKAWRILACATSKTTSRLLVPAYHGHTARARSKRNSDPSCSHRRALIPKSSGVVIHGLSSSNIKLPYEACKRLPLPSRPVVRRHADASDLALRNSAARRMHSPSLGMHGAVTCPSPMSEAARADIAVFLSPPWPCSTPLVPARILQSDVYVPRENEQCDATYICRVLRRILLRRLLPSA